MNHSKDKIDSFKDLKVWQKAMEISVEVYKRTADFPQSEMFGLTGQIRRASNSISLNIAEGHGRKSTKSYINFLSISLGSLAELESGLILSTQLEFANESEYHQLYHLIAEENKMLCSLIASLERKTTVKNNPN